MHTGAGSILSAIGGMKSGVTWLLGFLRDWDFFWRGGVDDLGIFTGGVGM